jgi:predicted nucleic acid-binding protein
MRQVVGYRELALLVEFYEEFDIVPCDEAAARQFDHLRRQKLHIGSRDLKIAATTPVNHALLLSATEPISKRCQAYESRNGRTDRTPGSERARN